MRIAILTPTFSPFSGIDRVVERQAKDLEKQCHDVTIICLRASINTKYAKVIELGMPKNPTLERIYRLIMPIFFWKNRKFVKQLQQYDYIISHQYPMTYFASRAKKKFGIRYTYHNAGVATPSLFSSPLEKIYMHLFRVFTNLSIKNADNAISISDYLKKVLEQETGLKSKVEYVRIDKVRFHKKVDGKDIRKKYGLGDSPVCLYVGRISPHKGIHLLIESFNLVLKELPDAKLIIVGKKTFGDYSKTLEKLARKVNKNNVIFAGFVPDEELPKYYAASDLYTTATLWEGFDMPIVEAYECGKPSVSFDIGAHPEVMHDGIMVPAKDKVAFAEAVIKMLKKIKKIR